MWTPTNREKIKNYMINEKILSLAKIVSQIHSKSLVPFYDNEDKYSLWEELEDKTNLKGDVDKFFFIKIAEFIIKKINKKEVENKQDALAKIMYDIHSSLLVPFYISKYKYEKYTNDKEDMLSNHNWKNLEYDANDKEVVDKKFFLDMAKFIIQNLQL